MSEIKINRRDLLSFLDRGIKLAVLGSLGSSLTGCTTSLQKSKKKLPLNRRPNIDINLNVNGILPSTNDELILADGLRYNIVASWGDQISLSSPKMKFGFNNDYTAFVSFPDNNPFSDSAKTPKSQNEGLLWVNHEAFIPWMLEERFPALNKKEKTIIEQESVGGSIIHIVKTNGEWKLKKNSPYNRRINANTVIPFSGDYDLITMGAKEAKGTLANCAGGITPWNTILTCEENYHHYYGDVWYRAKQKYANDLAYVDWAENDEKRPAEHYGWVVEVNPFTGNCKKLCALGRFSHEGATPVLAKNGKTVVYMGDDKADQYFYKFISEKKGSLETGQLYVAKLNQENPAEGEWLLLDINANDILRKEFNNQTELLISTRHAASILGATPLDRPEDVEIDPITGAIYLCCTNNKKNGNQHGQIYKFIEKNNDYTGTKFKHEIWKSGGQESKFSSPDNIAFDNIGNLWLTTDISTDSLNKGEYQSFGNNGLFLFPAKNSDANKDGPDPDNIIQIASAPIGAEFTGLSFSPDFKTLFISVQHPGEGSNSMDDLKSSWPNEPGSLPKPSVVAIQGELLNKITGDI